MTIAVEMSAAEGKVALLAVDSRRPRGSGHGPGDRAAAGPGVGSLQHPILTALDGGAKPAAITGEQVLNEILDLITDRLPHLALDDPARPRLAAFAPALGAALGRPRATAVEARPPA